jgi:hypothetical protein
MRKRTAGGLFFGLTVLLLVSGCTTADRKAQVVDGTGKPVGPVLKSDYSTTPIVGLRTPHLVGALRVWQGGLVADGVLYYESADCSGPPFIDARSVVMPGHISTLLSSTAIGAPGRTVYVAAAYGSTRTLRVGSFSSHEICYFSIPFQLTVVPARPVVDLNAQFTPPFTVRNGS